MPKHFVVLDRVSSHDPMVISAADGKSALKKFCKSLMSSGMYEYKRIGETWHLLSTYGSDFEAVPCIVDDKLATSILPGKSDADAEEIVGSIIDVFEDFLDDHGYVLENQERDFNVDLEPDELVNIYGSDYDELASKINGILSGSV